MRPSDVGTSADLSLPDAQRQTVHKRGKPWIIIIRFASGHLGNCAKPANLNRLAPWFFIRICTMSQLPRSARTQYRRLPRCVWRRGTVASAIASNVAALRRLLEKRQQMAGALIIAHHRPIIVVGFAM
jgi:hypothetical protein